MLIKVPAIKDSTRVTINAALAEHFKKPKDGADLTSVIHEVLNDRDLFEYLAAFLPQNKGLKMGDYEYYDDIRVDVIYGLAIPFNQLPRKTQLFKLEQFGGSTDFGISFDLPRFGDRDLRGYPSAGAFADSLNSVLSNPKEHIIDIPEILYDGK